MAEELHPVDDWSTLVPGEWYTLRSGLDTQDAVFLRPGDGSSALFMPDGNPPPETYDHSDWTVYPRR